MIAALRSATAGIPSGTQRTIPFDYSLEFELTGTPEQIRQKSVTISVESAFVAVSIGYGFVPAVESLRGLVFGPVAPPSGPSIPIPIGLTFDAREVLEPIIFGFAQALQSLPLDQRPDVREDAVLESGLRLNPTVAEQVLLSLRGRVPPPSALVARMFEVVLPAPELVQFRYAIFDEGSGREFQSEPILSTAGLGTADGDRPFRYFAQPIRFEPRTTIRMEVTELSTFRGQLFIALHGYKVLGGTGTPTGRIERARRLRRR